MNVDNDNIRLIMQLSKIQISTNRTFFNAYLFVDTDKKLRPQTILFRHQFLLIKQYSGEHFEVISKKTKLTRIC